MSPLIKIILIQPLPASQLDSPDSGYHPANCPVIQVPSYYSLRKQEAGRRSTLPAQGIRHMDVVCLGDAGLVAWLSFIADLL